jgi:hypothetical protein
MLSFHETEFRALVFSMKLPRALGVPISYYILHTESHVSLSQSWIKCNSNALLLSLRCWLSHAVQHTLEKMNCYFSVSPQNVYLVKFLHVTLQHSLLLGITTIIMTNKQWWHHPSTSINFSYRSYYSCFHDVAHTWSNNLHNRGCCTNRVQSGLRCCAQCGMIKSSWKRVIIVSNNSTKVEGNMHK